ncbi:uncharacterized protein LOC126907144 [Daktulosphaira vitifoliae]|uniref:uncharacterized protein LOC126907144 n=1 Tax=Daktulosphaira vitifoliae TaxID=58002 RepID=UPI0021AA2532|nr:uncharacterized protein LOC126907144 [Daktulosphaira vitifoliae]
MDHFSRFVQLYPLKKATGVATINRIINNYIPDWGKPKIIVSDHGKQFISKVWQSKLSMLGIPPTLTSVYHPQSNPTERVMRELGRLFRTYCSEYHAEWPRYVSYIEWVLNNTIHESTSFTPIELFFPEKHQSLIQTIVDFPTGSDIQLETKFEIAREFQKSKAFARKQRHDRIGPHTTFNIGDTVLVRSHKLSSGADKIINVKNTNSYVLQDPDNGKIKGTYNIIFLRKYRDPNQ